MGRFYCEYCDVYLKCASMNTRKEHQTGRRHLNNKIAYYQAKIQNASAQAAASGRPNPMKPPSHKPPLWLVKRFLESMGPGAQMGGGAPGAAAPGGAQTAAGARGGEQPGGAAAPMSMSGGMPGMGK